MFKKLKRLMILILGTIIITGASPEWLLSSSRTHWPPNPPKGSGIVNDPFLIASAEDLIWAHENIMARRELVGTYDINSGNAYDTNYKLIADITLPDNYSFGYWGDLQLPRYMDFGVFDGNNHTITINNTNGFALFTYYTNFDFRNLTISGNVGSGTTPKDCSRLMDYDDCECLFRVFGSQVAYPNPTSISTRAGQFDNVNVEVTWWYGTAYTGTPRTVYGNLPVKDEEETSLLDEMFHYVLHDHVKVIKSTSFAYEILGKVLIVRFNNPNDAINALSVGDTFIMHASKQAPSGLSGHVTGTKKEGNVVVITANIPSDIDEIFAELEIRVDALHLLSHEDVIVELAPQLQGVEGVQLIRNPTKKVGTTFDKAKITLTDGETTATLTGSINFINPNSNILYSKNKRLDELSFTTAYVANLSVELTGPYLGNFDEMFPVIKGTLPISLMSLNVEMGVRIRGDGTLSVGYTQRDSEISFGWKRSLNNSVLNNKEVNNLRTFCNSTDGDSNVNFKLSGSVNLTVYLQVVADILAVNVYGVVGEFGWQVDAEMQSDNPTNTIDVFRIARVSSAEDTLLTRFDIVPWFRFEKEFYKQPITQQQFGGIIGLWGKKVVSAVDSIDGGSSPTICKDCLETFGNLSLTQICFCPTNNEGYDWWGSGRQVEWKEPLPDKISILVDGKYISFTDQQPINKDGRILVPVRDVFEEIGYAVTWDRPQMRVTLVDNSFNTIVFPIDATNFTYNGAKHQIEVPAQLIDGRLMVPVGVLRTVGYEVIWNSITQTVIISTDE